MFICNRTNPGSPGLVTIHNNLMNCVASAGDEPFKLLTYQLPMVGHLPTLAMTGNGELGFDTGEGASEAATKSKEGSRRANYPILTQRGSDKEYQYWASMSCNWNE